MGDPNCSDCQGWSCRCGDFCPTHGCEVQVCGWCPDCERHDCACDPLAEGLDSATADDGPEVDR